MIECPSRALLARLRDHVNGCCQRAWARRCWPARGVYCSVGRPMYDAFYDARRAEVMGGRS